MNILLITNNLYPSGGDWTYVKSIADIYQKQGHKVFLWGQKNEKNTYHENEEFFVENVNAQDSRGKYLSAISILKRSIYSKESFEKLTLFLEKFRIDVAQINSINIGLTPSVIEALYSKHIPILWRILDYKPICPTIHLMRNNVVCEDCIGGKYYKCVLKKCKNNSLSDSIAVALETFININKSYYKHVNALSFQNFFTRNVFEKWKFHINDSYVINNPYEVSSIPPNYNVGDYVLYFGKTDENKGVMTLLKSAIINKDIKYVIVGVGAQDKLITSFIEDNHLDNVSFVGPKWGVEMEDLIDNCAFVVVPSEWYEPSPYVILQTYAHGKTLIASDIGGIPEMVKNNVTGLLFEPHNVKDLADKIRFLFEKKELIVDYGKSGRKYVEDEFSPDKYYKKTMDVFKKMIESKR